jgi:hypothetical protein
MQNGRIGHARSVLRRSRLSFWAGHHLRIEQSTRIPSQRQLGFQPRDPQVRRRQLVGLDAGHAVAHAGVNECLRLPAEQCRR